MNIFKQLWLGLKYSLTPDDKYYDAENGEKNMVRIVKANGRYAFDFNGETISYARRRDAVRGAARRGLSVA